MLVTPQPTLSLEDEFLQMWERQLDRLADDARNAQLVASAADPLAARIAAVRPGYDEYLKREHNTTLQELVAFPPKDNPIPANLLDSRGLDATLINYRTPASPVFLQRLGLTPFAWSNYDTAYFELLKDEYPWEYANAVKDANDYWNRVIGYAAKGALNPQNSAYLSGSTVFRPDVLAQILGSKD